MCALLVVPSSCDEAGRSRPARLRLRTGSIGLWKLGEVALEDVEGLVLVVVDVQRGPAAARVVDLDLREGVAGLGAGDLDGDPAGLPPDIGEALARRDAVGLGGGLDHLFLLLLVVVL